MAHYLPAEDLRALINDYRETGRVSEQLGVALMQLAGGVWDRFHFTPDREDFVQEVTLHLLDRPLAKVDVQKNMFSYLTTCAVRFGWKLRDKLAADQRRFATYAAELVEAGRPIPHANENNDAEEWSDEVDPKGHFESDRGSWSPSACNLASSAAT